MLQARINALEEEKASNSSQSMASDSTNIDPNTPQYNSMEMDDDDKC
jgi:hypothetical protein